MNTIAIILHLIAFGIGAATIPLFALAIAPSLPGVLAEPIARLQWIAGLAGINGPALIEQSETGEYQIDQEADDEDLAPESYWQRFAMSDIGITFEPTREAFGVLSREVPVDDMVAQQDLPGEKALADLDRGGVTWYIDLKERGLKVPIGEKLAELRSAAGQIVGEAAMSQGFVEFGGDTSQTSAKWMIGGVALMAAMGMGMGYVVFF